MFSRRIKRVRLLVPIFAFWLLPALVAQPQIPSTGGLIRVPMGSVEIVLTRPDGQALARVAVVTLLNVNGQQYRQEVTRGGRVRFDSVGVSEYNARIVAPGYVTATKNIQVRDGGELKLTIQLESSGEGMDAVSEREVAALGTKWQKELGKAIEALRVQKTNEARASLEKIEKVAPQNPEVQYLFGVCEQIQKNDEKAKAYWTKTLELAPQHYRALMSMSEALVEENQLGEAVSYLERAEKIEPTAWRSHALFAEAYLKQGKSEEAVRQARRALELGHGKAAAVEPILAAALRMQETGEQTDAAPAEAGKSAEGKQTDATESLTVRGDLSEALPSGWMPPDIDEKVGTLEPGAVCNVDDVLKKAGEKIQELLVNVDRFTATESLQHEWINKSGVPDPAINRRFNYVVEMQEIKSGFFNVVESRINKEGSNEFTDGLATTGLPAMVLIFHPSSIANFEITCEGLARRSEGLAWQLHFRQRLDRPNTIRAFRIGMLGKSHPINLKGRAWIAADTFQVLRLETQLIAPMREIDLRADYTEVEYGPVHFNKKNVDMWLPQTAVAYSYWLGKRSRQSHTFSNYALFSVEDKQKISQPKMKPEEDQASTVPARPATRDQ
jgi:tetratricopeptide (TPR) repeat protein